MKPATGSDSISDISEFVSTVDVHKVFEDGGLDQVRVQLSDAVDLVRADDGKEGHANHLRLRLLDDRHAAENLAVLGESPLNILQEVQVDLVNNLYVTGEEVLYQGNRPLFEGLGHHGVVGVAKGVDNDW